MSSAPDSNSVFDKAIVEHIEVIRHLQRQSSTLEGIAVAMCESLHKGGKVFWCGNGGSAADSQHLAAELVGRFRRERAGMASVALTTDSSALTSIANDYGFEAVFARQVEALGRAGDLLVGITTSGNSPNVVAAMEKARVMGLVTVGFTGKGGGKLAAICDHLFAVESRDTARIQEAHILAGHMLCDWIEADAVASLPATATTPEAQ